MLQPFIKSGNLILSGLSFLKSSVTGEAKIIGMPLSIGAELTNNCNLQCPECSSGSGVMQRNRGYMDIEIFKKAIAELKPYLFNINLYFQGEPMLHPMFFTFINVCKNTHTIVSTNGHYLSVENSEKVIMTGLSKLIISLDGTDQETYTAYRKNGNFSTVIEGINNITEAKKRYKSSLKIEIQFLVNKHNEHQIPRIRKIAGSVKASLSLKSMQVINKENIEFWLPSKEKFRRYKKDNGTFLNKNSLPDRCSRLWFNPVITWDGKVIPCCFDKNADYIMGDLNFDSFKDIWNGTKYKIFRKSILTGRSMIDICRNCTSGLNGVKY